MATSASRTPTTGAIPTRVGLIARASAFSPTKIPARQCSASRVPTAARTVVASVCRLEHRAQTTSAVVKSAIRRSAVLANTVAMRVAVDVSRSARAARASSASITRRRAGLADRIIADRASTAATRVAVSARLLARCASRCIARIQIRACHAGGRRAHQARFAATRVAASARLRTGPALRSIAATEVQERVIRNLDDDCRSDAAPTLTPTRLPPSSPSRACLRRREGSPARREKGSLPHAQRGASPGFRITSYLERRANLAAPPVTKTSHLAHADQGGTAESVRLIRLGKHELSRTPLALRTERGVGERVYGARLSYLPFSSQSREEGLLATPLLRSIGNLDYSWSHHSRSVAAGVRRIGPRVSQERRLFRRRCRESCWLRRWLDRYSYLPARSSE